MKALAKTIRVLLVAAVLAAMMPYHHPADMHRDGSIDLMDAVTAMHQLAGNGRKAPSPLADRLRTALAALEVAAGLKTVITTDATAGLTAQGLPLPPGLPAHVATAPMDSLTPSRPSAPGLFVSVDLPPPTPPPRLS